VKTPLESGRANVKSVLRANVARVIGATLFYSLLALIAVAAIPYGTAEPWWKALFQCVVFCLAATCVIQRLLWRELTRPDLHLLLPILALIVFAFLQTISWQDSSLAGIAGIPHTISADPFQSRLFISQLCALLLAGSLLVLHVTTRKRLGVLVEVIIAIGVISAAFGLVRQASQTTVGFGLPYLLPGYGYAQFINPNHFAFLMEMALGLSLGIAVCRGVSKWRLGLYLIAALPMWAALILANSRAGLFSILCQVLLLASLAVSTRSSRRKATTQTAPGWFWIPRTLAIRALLITALLAGALTTIIVLGGEPLARKLDVMSVELNQKTAEVYVLRLNIWQSTWDLIKDHPIAGVGFGAYWIAITQYHHASGEITPQEAHSDYLELLASGGLVGLAIGVWFAFAFTRAARRKLREADRYGRAVTWGALTGIMTVAVHSFVDYGLHITINALVFTALVSMMVMNVREKRNGSESTVESIRKSNGHV
jgi:O-antigen ligase